MNEYYGQDVHQRLYLSLNSIQKKKNQIAVKHPAIAIETLHQSCEVDPATEIKQAIKKTTIPIGNNCTIPNDNTCGMSVIKSFNVSLAMDLADFIIQPLLELTRQWSQLHVYRHV